MLKEQKVSVIALAFNLNVLGHELEVSFPVSKISKMKDKKNDALAKSDSSA